MRMVHYIAMHYSIQKIISHSVERTYLQGGEGCLSVDREVPGYVPRYTRITVKATSINGEEVKLRLKGLPNNRISARD